MSDPRDPNRQGPDQPIISTGSFNESLRNIRSRVFNDRTDTNVPAVQSGVTPFNQEKQESDFYITEEELEMLTFYDGTKGIYKLRYFMQTLFRELKRSKRYNRTTSVVVAAIDGYQNIFNQYGNPTCETIVSAVVQNLLDGASKATSIRIGRLGTQIAMSCSCQKLRAEGHQCYVLACKKNLACKNTNITGMSYLLL